MRTVLNEHDSRSPLAMQLEYVILTLFAIIRVADTTIEWDIEYGPDMRPTALTCRGPKTAGLWYKRWNRTDTVLGTFDENAQVTTRDHHFVITAFVKGGSNIQTRMGLPLGTFGAYACGFGSEHHTFYLPKNITTHSDSRPNTITLQCKDTRPPYNISWYVNSTLAAVVTVHNRSSYTVDDRNTSFTILKNISFYGSQATTNNTRPVCVTCIVHSNGTFGDHTVCSPYTKDLASNRQTRSENFVRASRLESDRPPDTSIDVSNVVSQATGLGFVIGSVASVCAIVGLILLIHVGGRRR